MGSRDPLRMEEGGGGPTQLLPFPINVSAFVLFAE